MNSIKDINSHCHDRGAKLLTLSPEDYRNYIPEDGQMLMVGVHPWDTSDNDMFDDFVTLSEAISDPHVVGIGEIGIDPLHGASVERQTQLLKYQLRVAVEARMPVMFHIVRRFDILLQMKKVFNPTAAWAVHGFRSNAEVVKQLAEAGIYMSVGPKFNADAVRAIPRDLLLLETDEQPEEAIRGVIETVAAVRGVHQGTLAEQARENLRRYLVSGQRSRV